ncbi:unnamed protein product [Microthlaspi erraticum]|uniref:Ubiquitin-like protease family profile domain-containing protein n=1 Tax=Microthlaspi erraticum TaxID=1685480 RepID=A0A6D2IYQ2_9BRAS|nr:unnamed protein product [Microthlaspi erraticum]
MVSRKRSVGGRIRNGGREGHLRERKGKGRLFPAGKSPLQDRSLHHNCKLTEFGQLKHSVGEEVFNDVMSTSQVGIILKLASRSYMWCAKTCHNLLTHQLAIESSNEIWSLFGDGEGPSWHELNGALGRCSTWTYEQKRMLALLFVVHIGIYGISRSSRISFKHAKRVLVPESFESYPWGRVGFKELMESIKVAKLDGKTYVVHGCVHALLIWAYEAIPIIGEKFGKRRGNIEIPLLRWESCRNRYNLEALVEEEKKKTGLDKVRVRQLVLKPLEEIYPVWAGEEAGGDIKLDNMIRDIVGGCLDESCWETEEQLLNKKKRKKKLEVVVDSDDDLVEKPLRKISSTKKEEQKTKKMEPRDYSDSESQKKTEDGLGWDGRDIRKPSEGLADEALANVLNTILENLLSWEGIVVATEVETSQEGITITRTIRNPAYDYKKPTRRKLELNDPIEKLGGDRPAGKTPFIIPQLSDGEDDEFLMKAFAANAQQLGRQGKQDKAKVRPTPSPDILLSPKQSRPRSAVKEEAVRPTPSPDILLSPKQSRPRSAVKEKRKAGINPQATYDPLEKVDRKKKVALLEYVKTYLDNPIESSRPVADFYLTLMTPKQQWAVDEYGWLSDLHMVAGMNMFRQRVQNKYLGHEKTFEFSIGHENHYNGIAPDCAVTNKKWVKDVDTLYIAHNILNTHWVAVEVDLLIKRVKVYDSIYSAFDVDVVKESVKPYMKLVPLLLRHVAPKEEKQQMGGIAYNFYLVKGLPQNDQTGDCGVYTLKAIECLALGRTLTGIDDTNVGDIRIKYAAEMMAEVDLSDFLLPIIPETSPYPKTSPCRVVHLMTLRRGWRRIRWIRCSSETIV